MKLELAAMGTALALLIWFMPQIAERLRPILPVQTFVPGNCRLPVAGEQLLIAVRFEDGRLASTECIYVMSKGTYLAGRER